VKVPEMRRFAQKIVCRHIVDMSKAIFKRNDVDSVLSRVAAGRSESRKLAYL